MTDTIAPPAPIGFVGIGHMGRPMAARLVGAGYALHIFDLKVEATRDFARDQKAAVAPSLGALAAMTSTVITMLPDSQAVGAAVLGAGGLAEKLAAGSLVIDMSSCDPTA